jgi:hypothetical protein
MAEVREPAEQQRFNVQRFEVGHSRGVCMLGSFGRSWKRRKLTGLRKSP